MQGSLLIALYSIRGERQFCERLMQHDVAGQFFDAVLAEAARHDLLSDDHFTVDGTLLASWASLKSFRPKERLDGPPPPAAGSGRNPDVDFHGQRRRTATHPSPTDPDARLARKGEGKAAKLCLAGHVLMENRHGVAVDVLITHATGTAERAAALVMLDRRPGGRHRATLGQTRITTPRHSSPPVGSDR